MIGFYSFEVNAFHQLDYVLLFIHSLSVIEKTLYSDIHYSKYMNVTHVSSKYLHLLYLDCKYLAAYILTSLLVEIFSALWQ